MTDHLDKKELSISPTIFACNPLTDHLDKKELSISPTIFLAGNPLTDRPDKKELLILQRYLHATP